MFLTRRNGIFYLNYMDSSAGKYKRVSTFANNQRDAFQFLESFSDHKNQHSNQSKLKLADFKIEYLDSLKNTHSPKYVSSIELSFKKLIKCLGNISLAELNNRNLEKFISYTFSKSQAAAGLYYRTLKAAMNKAVAWEYIQDSPFKKVKLPKIQKKIPIFISPNEFEQILLSTKSELMQNIFALAFHTGMRLGEIINMKWKWIDLERKTITVKNSSLFTTKGKKERLIPMNSVVHNLLTSYSSQIQESTSELYVFRIKHTAKLNGDYVSKNFKKALRKTTLNSDIHFHTLRHSFASNLVQNGASIYVCKELLGHEDIKTTMIYAHLKYQNLVDAVSLLEYSVCN